MKRKKWLLAIPVILLLFGCAAQKPITPGQPKDWTITVTFKYDFTNFPVCSATVTKGCVSGFTWGYLQGTTVIPLKTSPASVCTGTTQPESCTDSTTAQLGIGAVIPYAVANGVDNNGNTVSSTEATGPTDTVALVIPTGVSWTRQ